MLVVHKNSTQLNHTFWWRWQWISLAVSYVKSAYFHFSPTYWVLPLSRYCIASVWPQRPTPDPRSVCAPPLHKTSLIANHKILFSTSIKVDLIFKSVEKFKRFKYSKLPELENIFCAFDKVFQFCSSFAITSQSRQTRRTWITFEHNLTLGSRLDLRNNSSLHLMFCYASVLLYLKLFSTFN